MHLLPSAQVAMLVQAGLHCNISTHCCSVLCIHSSVMTPLAGLQQGHLASNCIKVHLVGTWHNWEYYSRKVFSNKNWTITDRSWNTVIFPCTIKSRRWQAITEEVDKGCSEFYVTVGTVIRTADILTHSRLNVLAVYLSQPSGRLWLYAGLIGSNNPRWLTAEWVNGWMSFFWYWLIQVVPDKEPLNGCVCLLAFLLEKFINSS